MSPVRIGIAAAAVVAMGWTTVSALEHASGTNLPSLQSLSEPRRTGPDSLRVASLLEALDKGDPLVCEVMAERIGNWWGSGGGVGTFSDAKPNLAAARDSLSGRIEHAGTINLLTKSLAHENPCVRQLAARWLGRSTIETARLVSLLDDPSPRVREAAAYAIGSGEKRKAIAPLEKMLGRAAGAEAAMAAWALAEEDDVASVPALERALRHDDARVRRASAYALGEIASLRALEPLSAALRDSDAEVRYTAARAIGELDDLEHPPAALLEACRSNDRRLARIAAMTVAELHDPATLDLLISLADMDDRDVRVHVAEALGQIGSAKANAPLMRMLQDQDAEVRRAAAEALGELRENATHDQ
ncbi:MAG TPA: HEAT repeat domain-containing protein [Gemmatimonas sp.]|uniref:HEAT repeat domain-containing protein n=1 Tax=Gemmatimonas sp. TaxID=1962908 RepID=UPI002ED9F7B7